METNAFRPIYVIVLTPICQDNDTRVLELRLHRAVNLTAQLCDTTSSFKNRKRYKFQVIPLLTVSVLTELSCVFSYLSLLWAESECYVIHFLSVFVTIFVLEPRRALVNAAVNPDVPYAGRISLLEQLLASQEGLCHRISSFSTRIWCFQAWSEVRLLLWLLLYLISS
jgi:hypothetical protein